MKMSNVLAIFFLSVVPLFCYAMDEEQDRDPSPLVREFIKKKLSLSGKNPHEYSTRPENEQHPSPEVRRHYSDLHNSRGRSNSSGQT